MCSDIDGRPGVLRAAWDALTGGSDPEPVGLPDDIDEIVATTAYTRALAHARNIGLGHKVCKRCGSVRDGECEAIACKGLCSMCELSWIENDILEPLVAAIGRKAARRALKGLVKRVRDLT